MTTNDVFGNQSFLGSEHRPFPTTSGLSGPGLSFHARPAITGTPGGPVARESFEPER